MNPEVSVIIPYYNRVEWLKEAIKSVLTQTFAGFEIIVVDDGSTEQFDPAMYFEDERIRFVRQSNRGASAARNTGIGLARGKFVAFLDADDLFCPQKLEIQLGAMNNNPAFGLSHTSYVKISHDGKPLQEIASGAFEGEVYPDIVVGCPIATPTVMVRRDVLGSLRFDESSFFGEDIKLWIEISKQTNFLGITECLSCVRIHGNNAAMNPEVQLEACLSILDYALCSDKNLGKMFRLKGIARAYQNAGMLYLEQGKRLKAFKSVVHALMAFPISFNGYSMLVCTVLPSPLITILRRMKERLAQSVR